MQRICIYYSYTSKKLFLNSYNKVIIELFRIFFPLFSVDLMVFLAHFAHCLTHIARYVKLHNEQNVLKNTYQLSPKLFKTASKRGCVKIQFLTQPLNIFQQPENGLLLDNAESVFHAITIYGFDEINTTVPVAYFDDRRFPFVNALSQSIIYSN